MATPRPLRTSMYVPGNKEDWMRKAPQYGADALILDLEDSVPIPNKAEARALVRNMLEELGGEKPTLTVRVNRLETGLTGEDLDPRSWSGSQQRLSSALASGSSTVCAPDAGLARSSVTGSPAPLRALLPASPSNGFVTDERMQPR